MSNFVRAPADRVLIPGGLREVCVAAIGSTSRVSRITGGTDGKPRRAEPFSPITAGLGLGIRTTGAEGQACGDRTGNAVPGDMDAGSTCATCEVAGCGLSRWKIEEKKRFGAAARGG